MQKKNQNQAFERVYELVRKIPKSRVTTYGAIAKKLNMNPRTVGYILHLNPDGAKTPCHRVVNFAGRVAPGYAFGGHGEQKKRLEKEGIKFKNEQNLDLKEYLFKI